MEDPVIGDNSLQPISDYDFDQFGLTLDMGYNGDGLVFYPEGIHYHEGFT